jgi:exosortase/archaeosortase family protein
MEATVHANIVDNISANFSVAIWPYCASSLPLAGVSLAFLVMVLYLGHPPRRRHVPWLCMSFVGSILLTEIRLLLLATNEASYEWWHDGPGVSVYAVAALVLAVVFPILATRGDRTAKALLGNRHVA